MSSYLEWNDALAAHFFRPEMGGRPVYLYVNAEVIAQIGKRVGGGVTGFISAVKEGPPWATHEGVCQKALQAYRNWRDRKVDWPSYIAYLCLFVLAVGLEGSFAPHAYYPRLRSLLGDRGAGTVPSFDQMLDLWEDLEVWSISDKKGGVGSFKSKSVGGWIHVGYPIAQAILSEQERKALPGIFAEAGLDPTSPVSPEELARVLRSYGEGCMRSRTLDLLKNRDDEERCAMLLEVTATELNEWDGQVKEDAGAPVSLRARSFASLRLCLVDVDLTVRRVKAQVRCKLNREFPEDRLVLSASTLPSQFWCEELGDGWSSPLKDALTDMLVDAGKFDWSKGIFLEDQRLRWRFSLPARPARILVTGSLHGLPGLVEVQALPRCERFFLAFEQDCWHKLERWAQEDCRGFTDHGLMEGLPPGWHLAEATQAVSDAWVPEGFSFLSLPRSPRLKLVGGIRGPGASSFFFFAPPRVYVEGGDGSEEVWCGNQNLLPAPDRGGYELPPELPHESRIIVELRSASLTLKRQSLYLTGAFSWRCANPLQAFDRWGSPCPTDAPGQPSVVGAIVRGDMPGMPSYWSIGKARQVLEQISYRGIRRVFLVGRVPGQIACWPTEKFPAGWEVVWAIPLARRGQSIYCPANLMSPVLMPVPGKERRRVRLWKEVLWHRRRRITPPTEPLQMRLWREFQEAARHV